MKTVTLFWEAPKSLQMVTAAMKFKDACSLEERYDQPRQRIKKKKHYFANKGPSSQSYGFSSKEQASFNFMSAVTICSDFGAQENKV